MQNTISEKSNRLPVLLAAARDAHDEAARFNMTAADRGLAAGAALSEAKALLPRGTWGAWLRETGIPDRTAQRYMALHKAGCVPAIVADLGWSEAERLASLGRKIWPRDGFGFEAVAIDGAGSRVYILTLSHEDGSASYFACYMFADPALDFWMMRRCRRPVAFGLLFSAAADHFDIARVEMLTPDKALAAWGEIKGEYAV